MLDILRRGLGQLGLDPSRAEPLADFAAMVLEKNKVMNLTAITEASEFARLHLLDSAALLGAAELSGKSIIDVGTGAGFPGVPLCILCPEAHVTLLDSTGKRIDFLRESCEALGLRNARCVHARAEEYAAAHRESFDYAASRAVAALPVLCELCLPLVKPGGQFLAMKSVDSGAELDAARRAIQALGGKVNRVTDYTVPETEVVHRLIVIDKVSPTPLKYPRAFGQIKKKPL